MKPGGGAYGDAGLEKIITPGVEVAMGLEVAECDSKKPELYKAGDQPQG